MRNTRMANKRILKWVASGVMLALLFAMVFAGTLSGAFGVEEGLKNSGVIENNVASADWNHKAGITIGDSNSGGTNVTAMSAITEVGTCNYYGTTTLTNNYGVYMSDGSSGDIKRTTSTVGIYQGITGTTRNGMVYIVIPLSSEVQSVVDQERVTVSFSGLFGGGNPDYSTYKLFVYSSSKEVVAGSSYSQSDFKDSILNTATNSTSSSSGTLATGNAGYCNATGIPDTDQDESDSDYSARTISANVIKGAKSLVLGIMVRGGGYHGLARRKMMVFMRNASVTLNCSSAKISVTSGENGSVSKVASSGVTISGSDYTFTKILSCLQIKATPNSGYHFSKWQKKTSSSVTSDYNTDVTSSLASSTATFYGYKIWNNEAYTANFEANQVTVVYHKNLESDTSTTTATVTYTGSTTTLRSESATGKSFLGWSTSANSRVLYHSAGSLTVAATNIGLDSDGNVVDLTNATHHGKTVHLYAVWSERDFGITSGKDYDSTWGSQDNPFVIENARHLVTLSEIVNGTLKKEDTNSVTGGTFNGQTVTTNAKDITFAECYFVLGADIDMSGIDFVPIGAKTDASQDAPTSTFCAVQFEFYGHSITNLSITSSGNFVGLFGYNKVTILKNSSDTAAQISGTIKGAQGVGALVGYNHGTISGKFIVDSDVTGSDSFVGGVVGRNHGNIDNATFTHDGTVNGNSANSVGGIFGFTGGNLKNAVNSGSVTGGTATGGIVGRIQGTLENCVNYASVESSAIDAHSKEVGSEIANFPKLSAVGGITGYSNNYIKSCTNNGTVTASGNGVGGIVGVTGLYNNGWKGSDVSNCTNNATVIGKNYTGGLVGYAIGTLSGTLNNTGCVSGVQYVGGIVGEVSAVLNSDKTYNLTAEVAIASSTLTTNDEDGVLGQQCVGGVIGHLSSGITINGTITVSGCDVDSNGFSDVKYLGGIVGYNDGTLISTNGTVYVRVIARNSGEYAGGIVGYNTGTVNGTFEKTGEESDVITVSGGSYIGGICAYNSGTLTGKFTQSSTYVTHNATVFGKDYVGGFVGKSDGVITATEFSNAGTIKGTNYVSGGIGYGTIGGEKYISVSTKAKNSGAITATGEYAGGIFGYVYVESTTNNSIVAAVENSGAISGGNYVGGIAGIVQASGASYKLVINTSTNNNSVSGASYVGGIVGWMQNTTLAGAVINGTSGTSYNVIGTGNYVGGIIGDVFGGTIEAASVTNYMAVSGVDYVGGIVGNTYAGTIKINSQDGKVVNNGNVTASHSTAAVDTGYTIVASASQNAINDNDGNNEDINKIKDNKTGTKYCSGSVASASFVAKANSGGYLRGFSITNANDNEKYPERTVKVVKIWGSNSSATGTKQPAVGEEPTTSDWVLLYSNSNIGMINTNITAKSYDVTGVTESYKYYWVYLEGTNSALQLSEFDFTIEVPQPTYTGGVIGYYSTDNTLGKNTILESNGKVESTGYFVGGIIGCATGITLNGANNTGEIIGRSNAGSGGVAGIIGGLAINESATLTNCSNSGTITAPSANGVAGIIGRTESKTTGQLTVSGCSNTGDVTGYQNVGGIGGRMETSANGSLIFKNCYNNAQVTVKAGGTGGGIAGYFYAPNATIENTAHMSYCFSEGGVVGKSNIGSIVGNPNINGASSESTAVHVEYCYTTDTSLPISGKNYAKVENTNYIISTEVPINLTSGSITNGGSYLLHDVSMKVAPAVVDSGSYTAFTYEDEPDWTKIAQNDINVLKVYNATVDPTIGQSFSSLDADNTSTYIKPNSADNDKENAAEFDNQDKYNVSAWYVIGTGDNQLSSNARLSIVNISINAKSGEYSGTQQGFARNDAKWSGTNLPVDSNIYTVDYVYKNETYNEICTSKNGGDTKPTNVGEYQVKVVVYIDSTDVGTYTYTTYTISQATLTINPDWTDGDRPYTYNATQQGLRSFTITGFKASDSVGNGVTLKVESNAPFNEFSYTPEGNTYSWGEKQCINADTYYVDISIEESRNYKFDSSTKTFSWTIGKYNLNSSDVHFGANDSMLLGNTTSWKYSNALQVWELNGALVYTKSGYSKDNIVAYVQFNGGTPIELTVDTDYKLGGWNNSPGDLTTVTLTATGAGNYTGTIKKTFLAMDSDFGGSYTITGWGGSDNKFKIEHEAHLIRLSEIVNGGKAWNSISTNDPKLCATNNASVLSTITSRTYQNAYFEIALEGNKTNLDMSGYAFKTIGTSNGSFKATQFDFKGFGITGLNIKSDSTNVGLFGWITGSTTITNSKTTAATVSGSLEGADTVGGLIGINYGTVSGSFTINTKVTSTGGEFTGGVIGRNRGSVNGASFTHTGEVKGRVSTGGIMGFSDEEVKNAINNGTVEGTTAVGGIVGSAQGVINGCTNNAEVKSSSSAAQGGEVNGIGAAVGGIVGYSDKAITGCKNTGAITAANASGVGGIVGIACFYKTTKDEDGNITDQYWQGIKIDGCENNGSVIGKDYVGGIAGYWQITSVDQYGAIKNVIEGGNAITVKGNTYVGGIVGWLEASSCPNSLTVSPDTTILNNNKISVTGKNCVGYLFGAFLGNGYHETATATIGTTLKIGSQFEGTVNGVNGGAVLGGLVGFMSKSAMIFSTNWETGKITFYDLEDMSFVGGLIGMLGENGTIESVVQFRADGGILGGAIQTITANAGLGEATISDSAVTVTSKLGSFVGGIVGYVTSSAGAYYGSGTRILGNTVKLISNASIYADGYVGGIYGAIGDFDNATADSIAEKYGKDIKSYLVNLLETGNFAANKGATTLAINPNGNEKWHAKGSGQLVNNGGGYIWADGYYAGGIIGYVGAYATITLENDKNNMLTNTGAINSDMSVYVDRNYVFIRANSYAGGLIGYLSNGAHSLKYIVSGAHMGANTEAQYVGGVVGYMGSGTIEGCIAIYPDAELWSYSSTYKGAQNVGGIVGFTINGVITNCVSAGFNLEETTSTKGGILGGGVNPTITSSWAFYIAREGSTYTRVSNNSYGKYIAVDDKVDQQLTIADLVDIVKGDSITFDVSIPSDNRQLAFYNGTGSDTVTSNAGNSDTSKFTEFSQQNSTLIIGLNKATAESMQVYVVDIEFVDIPQYSGSDETVQKATVRNSYRHPSNSENYEAEVLTAEFSNNYISKISANIYFNPKGDGGVLVGTTFSINADGKQVGSYNVNNLAPGSAASPFTISSLKEWNDFAESVQNGTNSKYSGKTVKLLNDIPLKGETGTVTLAGIKGSGFMGTFDGNGHTIDIGTITASADGTSLFPYANDATFKNLTIKGNITLDNTVLDSATACNGVAGFVGIAEGKLTFHNCTNQVNITTKGYNVGGILGQSIQPTATGTTYEFIDCVNEGKIQNWYKEYKTGGVGGIIGNILTSGGPGLALGTTTANASDDGEAYISVTLESCRNAGIIEGTFNVGGIIGRNGGDTTIKNCGNSGNITAYGITWTYENGEFKNAAQVNGQDTSVGGIGGLVTQKGKTGVYASYNSGKIVGWGNKAGGILASDAEYATSSETTKIYYCYNTGDVMTGGDKSNITQSDDGSASWGCNSGGILGTMVNADIQYCYNTGTIKTNGSYYGAWYTFTNRRKARVGGIVGFIDSSSEKTIKYCYNIGDVWVGFQTSGDETGAASIVGGSKDNDAANSLTPNFGNNYSLKNIVHQYNTKGQVETAGESNNYNYTGDSGTFHNGTLLSSIDSMTAYMGTNKDGEAQKPQMPSGGFGIGQNITALSDITTASGGYIYVYGCLPQLAVFAVDTQNGLAMTSKAYGQDQYGKFNLQQAGSVNNPFIIKDGIDLLGLQALVENGYYFDNKYIEFANSDNNLDGFQTKEILFPTDSSTSGKYSGNGYKATDGTTEKVINSSGVEENRTKYTEGKSYHLFKLGAVCASDTTYQSWIDINNYHNASSTASNKTETNATFDKQNMLAIGRTIALSFHGNISGKQSDDSATKLMNVRISTGYAGLFSVTKNATVSYIELSGSSKISSTNVAGGIVARPRGTSVVDHCAISGNTTVKSYGTGTDFSYSVGGIVGYAYTRAEDNEEFEQGAILTISNCKVNTTGEIVGYKENIGGILGTALDYNKAEGKNNKVIIENCKVLAGNIHAVQTDSQYVGGIMGYSSFNGDRTREKEKDETDAHYAEEKKKAQKLLSIIVGITDCEVGTGTGNVTISGKTNIGGIVGAMSSVPGGYIQDCTVGAKATIKATADDASSIGGLVGSSDAATTDDGITMDFARENSFAGVIDLDGKKASNVGGIIGRMNNGASFNENSVVSVIGKIINVNVPTGTITEDSYSTNFGGVAGLTSKVGFSGQFTVTPTMDTDKVDNVGGFIGKNEGKTDIVAVGTTITIGGKISGLKEVGGFIGINDTGATLTIGDDMYNGVPRTGAVTITINAAISSEGDNVGGIVGKNDNGATINIVKGTISTAGKVEGNNNVGGIVGLNDGDLVTGGSDYSDAVLSITNGGSVVGQYFVGGLFGRLNKGNIAGVFTNDGSVKGDSYVGGAIGFVAQGVTITSSGSDVTRFVNTGIVTADNYFAGGSIGILYGSINGASGSNPVEFTVQNKEGATEGPKATVSGKGYVGGSIGVIAGKVNYAKFVNSADLKVTNAQTAIGGSVGFVGLPDKNYVDNADSIFTDNLDNNYGKVVAWNKDRKNTEYYIYISNTHFEATGSLTVETTSTQAEGSTSTTTKTTDSGGVGGAIGVIGGDANKFTNSQWNNNTYYAKSDVKAPSVNNVGGVFGLIRANGFEVNNMLAYQTTVQGNENVGGIVGAVDATGVKISQCFALEGAFSGAKYVGGIVGLARSDTDASSSYWMLGLGNDTLAESDIETLSTKLGFTLNTNGTFKKFSLLADDDPHIYTTGDDSHGWFFIYANNANGADGIGTINVTHKAGSTNGVPNSLAYWKYIAQAYSSSETVPTSMSGSALTSNGSIDKGTVYATATAAPVQTDASKTGYYLYTETSVEGSNPNIDYQNNTFYINIKPSDGVGNFVVYYREINPVGTLTYNGYARTAAVGMSDVKVIDKEASGAGENYPTLPTDRKYLEYKNSYRYTTKTEVTTTNADGTTSSTDISGDMIDQGVYNSTFYIYYFDNDGTSHLVGGHGALGWEIAKRKLELDPTNNHEENNSPTYGEETTGADMTLVVKNIAPANGATEPITVIVTDGNNNTYEFDYVLVGDSGVESIVKCKSTTNAGITIKAQWKYDGQLNNDNGKNDLDYIVGGTDGKDLNTITYTFQVYLTQAKSYTVSIDTTNNYTFDDKQLPLTVKQRALEITPSWSENSEDKNGSKEFDYNTKIQGIVGISVNAENKSNKTGLLANDVVIVIVKFYKGSAISPFASVEIKISQSGVSFGGDDLKKVSTLDADTYKVEYAVKEDETGINYKIASSTKEHNWTITPHTINLNSATISFKDDNKTYENGGNKTYDALAVTPVLSISNLANNSGTEFKYGNDTITLKYKTDANADTVMVNAKSTAYEVKVESGDGVITATRDGKTVLSTNYTLDGSISGTFTINPAKVTIDWNSKNFVYNKKTYGLTVQKVSLDGTTASASTNTQDKLVFKGHGNDTVTLNWKGQGENADSYTMKLSSKGVSGTNAKVDSISYNYDVSLIGGSFEIVKSKIYVSSANGSATKVYDGTDNGDGCSITSATVGSKNEGYCKVSWSTYFNVSYKYDFTDVGTGTVSATFTWKGGTYQNYANGGDNTCKITGKITPAHISVVLDKLRNNKATKAYDGDNIYSAIGRIGEGFTVNGVIGSDAVTITAKYAEADGRTGKNSTDLSSYVNGVYYDTATSSYKQVTSSDTKYFKKLVFTMDGDGAKNYTFNVYDSSNTAYSSNNGTGKGSTVTVYDSRDTISGHKNANSSTVINIEITTLTERVDYRETYQSYVNDDNEYNTDWKEVGGTLKDGTEVVVNNGWMYKNGKDGEKREYTGYTVIYGRVGSTVLSAEIDSTNGMNFNYRLSNQPTLTIAYFVAEKGDFPIDSMADLLIASFYYSASQNNQAPEFVQIIQSDYKWHQVVTNEDYLAGTKPSNTNFATWDAYFDHLETQGYYVFLNENTDTADGMVANTWGYFEATSEGNANIPTLFRLVKDLNGTLTKTDIQMLNAFFTVAKSDDNGNITQTSYEWGYGKDQNGNDKLYLTNLLTTNEGSVVTLLGSLFVTASGKDGFGGTFDGNGYVIEYLNIMGYGSDNVGLFDVINDGTVKNLHLRNISINANGGNVGGIAGQIKEGSNAVSNVSFHGSINASGAANVGGLFGKSERAISNAIVLGTINSSNSNANVGGVAGNSSASISYVVSMMQITANSNNTHAFVGTSANAADDNSYYMANAVYNGTAFVKENNAKTYSELMAGSKTGYGNTNKYYYNSSISVGAGYKGTYDVLDDYAYVNKASENDPDNAKQSMRLCDIVSVYLLMYSLDEGNTTIDNSIKVYTISGKSWLVGSALGTDSSPIIIANKQNVSLLRELRFATFTLGANIDIEIASTFSGTFYGTVYMNGKIISCNKEMFDVYCNDVVWLKLRIG